MIRDLEVHVPGDFLHSTLGRTGWPVFRLGLSASYRPGLDAIREAIDRGVNFLFAYGFDGQMLRTLRQVCRRRRDELIVATGGYATLIGAGSARIQQIDPNLTLEGLRLIYERNK